MKKANKTWAVLPLLLAVIFCMSACGAAGEDYEALRKKGDTAGAAALFAQTLEKGDWEKAAQIAELEYSIKTGYSKLPADYENHNFDRYVELFQNHFAVVRPEIWIHYFLYDTRGTGMYDTGRPPMEDVFAKLQSYQRVTASFGDTASQRLKVIFDNVTSKYSYTFQRESMEDFYAQCGKKADGKVLIFTVGDTYLDNGISFYLMGALPEERLPVSLDDVQYVVLIETASRQVGNYSGDVTSKAIRYYKTVSVYDCVQGQLIFSEEAAGTNPPSTIPAGKTMGEGELPTDAQVLSLLERAMNRIL